MRKIERGVACAGCPHRAAYVACKEALGRGKNKVICGNAGCAATGPMHPAATVCAGGEDALLPRYKQGVPSGGTPSSPAMEACIHFALDTEIAANDAPQRFAALAAEGATTVLAINVSSRAFLEPKAIEDLCSRVQRTLGIEDVVALDPLDTLACADVLHHMLARPGVHAIAFCSPCAQLQGDRAPAPVEIDRIACVGCQRCKQITGCPALIFAPPAYTVDADACAGCDLCCSYCRTHVIYSPRVRMAPPERAAMRYAAALHEAEPPSGNPAAGRPNGAAPRP